MKKGVKSTKQGKWQRVNAAVGAEGWGKKGMRERALYLRPLQLRTSSAIIPWLYFEKLNTINPSPLWNSPLTALLVLDPLRPRLLRFLLHPNFYSEVRRVLLRLHYV